MIKGSVQKEDVTVVNIYALNIGAPQYIRQILTAIKGEIDSNTIIVGGALTPHFHQQTAHSQSSKETKALNDTLNLIFVEHSIQKQHNTNSSQAHMEHSPGLITY